MAINLSAVVGIILMLLIAAGVFGLLYYLVCFVGSQFPGEGGQLFVKFAKIVLVVLAVLVGIGILLSLAGDGPTFHWGTNPPPPVVR